jgi:hypothetical protein
MSSSVRYNMGQGSGVAKEKGGKAEGYAAEKQHGLKIPPHGHRKQGRDDNLGHIQSPPV